MQEERITTVAYPEAQEGERQIDLKEFEINKLKENLSILEKKYAKLARVTSLYRDTLINICKEIGGDI